MQTLKWDTATVWGRGAASRVCEHAWLTLLSSPSALIGYVKTAGGFLQIKLGPLGGATVDFYTVDVYFMLLSDHYDNCSKYKTKL